MTTPASHPKADAVPRGCGSRQESGIYLETGLGPGGQPLEFFLLDPPLPVATFASAIAKLGVSLFEHQGVTHVLDWIGSVHYPCPSDILEEVRRFGLSRRAQRSLDFSRLTPFSRIFVVHDRGRVINPAPLLEDRVQYSGSREQPYCPKYIDGHRDPENALPCAALHWETVPSLPGPNGERIVTRRLPSFQYVAATPPKDVFPTFAPAVFAWFPLHRIAVIKGDQSDAAYDAASKSSLPVDLEER
jgi:hypothetical protein